MKVFVIGLALLVGGLSLSYAQSRYNVLKDPSFESTKECWKESAMPEDAALSSQHASDLTAPDGGYVGFTAAMMGGKGTQENPPYSGRAALIQEFTPRIVSDFNLDSSLEWWVRWIQVQDTLGPYEWGVTILSNQGDSLEFKNPGKQDTWTHILYNIYEEWIKKGLSEKDSLYKIELWATSNIKVDSVFNGWWPEGSWEYVYGCEGEKVTWDLVCLYSKRPDLDAELLSIDSPDRLEKGYEPKATVKNPGAFAISLSVICNISQDGDVIYSDTSQIDSLKPDSLIQVSFKPYSGSISSTTYTLKIYAFLEGDQNPANDTLEKSLTTTGISEKLIKDFDFKLSTLNSKTLSFSLSLPSPAPVSISLYDVSGRLIKSWRISAPKGISSYKKALKLSAGVYFLRAESLDKAITRKIVIVE